MTAEVCEPLHKLTLVKADRTQNRIYEDLHVKVKTIIKRDAGMMYYAAARLL